MGGGKFYKCSNIEAVVDQLQCQNVTKMNVSNLLIFFTFVSSTLSQSYLSLCSKWVEYKSFCEVHNFDTKKCFPWKLDNCNKTFELNSMCLSYSCPVNDEKF